MKDFIHTGLNYLFMRTYSLYELVAYFIALSIVEALLITTSTAIAVVAAVILIILIITSSMYFQNKFTDNK